MALLLFKNCVILQIYRVYSNNQEYELFRLKGSLQNVPNETRMIVRLGRALLPGEFRIKLSMLSVNETEVRDYYCDAKKL